MTTRTRATHASRASALAASWLFVSVLGLAFAAAAPSLLSPKRPSEHSSELPPGWAATCSAPGKSGKTEATTHAVAPAFSLADGETFDPRVPARDQTVEFSGLLRIDEPGRYRFHLEAEGGAASFSLLGKGAAKLASLAADAARKPATASTDAVALAKGEYTVSIAFARRALAPARLRTMWECEPTSLTPGFRREPLPPSLISVPKFARTDVASGIRERHGRALMGELGCLHCHSAPGGDYSVFREWAPLLADVASRANADWLRRWITDPQVLRPGSAMPDILSGSLKDREDAESIVHFLAILGKPSQPAPLKPDELAPLIADGRKLFHSVGCVACHGPYESPATSFDEAGAPAETPNSPAPLPLRGTENKYTLASLRDFLLDPVKHRPQGRMPSLNLSAAEARSISAYLTSRWNSSTPAFTPDPARAELGKAVYAARGCASCHSMGHDAQPVKSTLSAKPLAALRTTAGCLDPRDESTPRYTLSQSDRDALAAAITSVKSAAGARAPLDEAHRLFESMNCAACHSKDGVGGHNSSLSPYFRCQSDAELGDEGRYPPDLTGVGWKLKPSWLQRVLSAKGVARPYLSTRMPQFGSAALAKLGAALSAEQGLRAKDAGQDIDQPDPALVKAGHALVGDQGLNCISCHVFADLPAAGTPGPNITSFAERLRPEWWKSYVITPQRYKPGTRMPAFYQTGAGAITGILAGNPDKQAEALWAYFSKGGAAPVPSGLAARDDTRLIPDERPIVFRAFLKDAGSRAIGVGFPAGIHFAFDGETCRLVGAWKGEFLDAAGSWVSRAGQTLSGRGPDYWVAPPGPTLIAAPSAPTEWPRAAEKLPHPNFKGYRLDAAGVPTFSYVIASTTIEERFEPGPDRGTISRTFKVTGPATSDPIWIRVPAAAALPPTVTAADLDADFKLVRLQPRPDSAELAFTFKP